MGLCRVAVFVSYVCLLRCDLYQARVIEKENTTITLKIPFYYLPLFSDKDNGDTDQKKPSAVVLHLPSSGPSPKKTNILIDLTGKSKQCQYSSEGKVPKNETLNVDVYVLDKKNSTIDTGEPGYLKTSSGSAIEDDKEGIKVIGASQSSTPNSNLTVFVKVYIIDSDKKNESDVPTITTNSTISSDDVADADSDAQGSEGFTDGNGGGSSSGDGSSGDGTSCCGSSNSGSSGGGVSGDDSSDSGSKDGESSDDSSGGGSSGNEPSDSVPTGGVSSGDGSSDGKSPDSGSPDDKAAAAGAAGAVASGNNSAAAAAPAAAAAG